MGQGTSDMNLFISPHNDDECLFACYTLIREHPVVVIATDSVRQEKLGVTAEQRREESLRALSALRITPKFLGIRDEELSIEGLGDALGAFKKYKFNIVYAPSFYKDGNSDHNIVSAVAKDLWGEKVVFYATYTKTDLHRRGTLEIIPSDLEVDLKNKALDAYVSQIKINKPHFDAVRGKSEYLDIR
jgi:LmbE family N-acetylglucosaminyl deacetylase